MNKYVLTLLLSRAGCILHRTHCSGCNFFMHLNDCRAGSTGRTGQYDSHLQIPLSKLGYELNRVVGLFRIFH